jgi:hypothetical protein
LSATIQSEGTMKSTDAGIPDPSSGDGRPPRLADDHPLVRSLESLARIANRLDAARERLLRGMEELDRARAGAGGAAGGGGERKGAPPPARQ